MNSRAPRNLKLAIWRAWTPRDVRRIDVPSLGLTSLVAHARHEGHLIDAEFCIEPAEMLDADADVYAIGSDTSSWPRAATLASTLVAHGKTVVVGGPHITALPESLPPGCTGVIGEGERAFAGLLDRLDAGETLPRFAPAVPRLDLAGAGHLPVFIVDGGHVHAVASRGCPFRCWFCSASRAWPGAVTRFSPDHVAASIGEHFRRQFPPRPGGLVTFQDLHFASDVGYAVDVCKRLAAWGAPDRFRLSGCTFSALLSRDRGQCERLLRALVAVGLTWVGIGIESASPRLFSKLKPHLAFEDNERLIEICSAAGVTVHASFIVGVPGETENDLRMTRDFVAKHTAAGFFRQSGLFVYGPYPGTPGWRDLLSAGDVSVDMDFAALRIGANPARERVFFANPAMSYKTMLRWRRAISAASRLPD